MLKHSISQSQSHYGLTTTRTSPTTGHFPLPTTPPPHITSSSHNSGDSGAYNIQHHHHQQPHQYYNHHHGHQSPMPLDPTRYLEGLPAPTKTSFPQYHSQNYLDQQQQQQQFQQQQYPSVHNSRLPSSTYNLAGADSSALGPSTTNPRGHSHSRSRIMKQSLSPSSFDISPVKPQNGSIYFTSPQPPGGGGPNNPGPDITLTSSHLQQHNKSHSHLHPPGSGSLFRQGVLRSLSLLSILSLLLALNALVFLLKIIWPLNMSGGGSGSEFQLMYEVTLCLAAMCLSINLCVLLVSSAQYFFAISGSPGTTSFLHRVTFIRGIGITGFFLSIPLYLAAIVLYTFTHLSFAIPALATTAIIGLAIIFGGCAMVYHVFTWQKEKLVKRVLVSDVSPNPTIELSTLV